MNSCNKYKTRNLFFFKVLLYLSVINECYMDKTIPCCSFYRHELIDYLPFPHPKPYQGEKSNRIGETKATIIFALRKCPKLFTPKFHRLNGGARIVIIRQIDNRFPSLSTNKEMIGKIMNNMKYLIKTETDYVSP